MEITLMHNQISICCLERSQILCPNYCTNPYSLHGFLIPKKPISGISLNTKRVKESWSFSVGRRPKCGKINALLKVESNDNGSSNKGNAIDKEFKFQPSFDEYLKAMESVKTCRENSPTRDDDENHPRKKSTSKRIWKPTIAEEDQEKSTLEEHAFKVKKPEFLARDRLPENSSLKTVQEGHGRGKLGFRDRGNRTLNGESKQAGRVGFTEKGGVESAWDSVQHKLVFDENNENSEVSRGSRENNGKWNSEGTNGRWSNDHNRRVDQEEDSGFSKSKHSIYSRKRDSDGKYDVKSFKSNKDDEGGKLSRNINTREMQGKHVMKDELQVKARASYAIQSSTEVSRFRKSGVGNFEVHKTSVDKMVAEHKIGTYLDKKKFDRHAIEREPGETSSNRMRKNEHFERSNFGRKTDATEINSSIERRQSYDNQMPFKLKNVSEIEQQDRRNRDTYLRLDSRKIQVDDTRHANPVISGKSIRGNIDFVNDDDDESDVEMERAAFKSFEVFTDVRGMPRVSRMEMEERIQHLAKWLNGADIDLPEWMFSKMMRSAQIKFTDNTILRVIQVLGTFGNWRRVLQVIEWFQSRERFKSHKSRYIYTAALDVLGKAKRPVEALNVFHAMRQELSSYPDLAAYHCIAVTLGQAGHMKELLDVIDCMRSLPEKKFKLGVLDKWDPRLEPDLVIYNAVLNACIRRKQWEGAFWVLQQLKEQSLHPSSTTYGLLMEVMLACEKYNLVHEFFRKVEKSSSPNSLNYKVLVNTLWKEGKTDEAVVAVEDMERRGIVGSASLYYDLARCLCSAGRCQEALNQIDKICKVATKPLVVTYTGLIQACLTSGNVEDASYIFEQMHKFCSPNVVTYNIMLKGYLDHGLFEKAKDLFQRMLDDTMQISTNADYREKVLPDNYTFNTMLDCCVSEKKWDDFSYVYQRMLHHGCHFNTKRHLRMVLEACRAGKGELLDTTWKYLKKGSRVPPAPMVKERFLMKLEEDDIAGAIYCITNQQTTNELNHAFSEKAWFDLLKTNSSRFQKNTLIRLTDNLNNIIVGNDQPHPILQNLITSCRKFVQTFTTKTDIDLLQNEPTLITESNTKL